VAERHTRVTDDGGKHGQARAAQQAARGSGLRPIMQPRPSPHLRTEATCTLTRKSAVVLGASMLCVTAVASNAHGASPDLLSGAPHASTPPFLQDARLLEMELQQDLEKIPAGSPKQLSNANTPRTLPFPPPGGGTSVAHLIFLLSSSHFPFQEHVMAMAPSRAACERRTQMPAINLPVLTCTCATYAPACRW